MVVYSPRLPTFNNVTEVFVFISCSFILSVSIILNPPICFLKLYIEFINPTTLANTINGEGSRTSNNTIKELNQTYVNCCANIIQIIATWKLPITMFFFSSLFFNHIDISFDIYLCHVFRYALNI